MSSRSRAICGVRTLPSALAGRACAPWARTVPTAPPPATFTRCPTPTCPGRTRREALQARGVWGGGGGGGYIGRDTNIVYNNRRQYYKPFSARAPSITPSRPQLLHPRPHTYRRPPPRWRARERARAILPRDDDVSGRRTAGDNVQERASERAQYAQTKARYVGGWWLGGWKRGGLRRLTHSLSAPVSMRHIPMHYQ